MPERLVLLVNPRAGRRPPLERWPDLPDMLATRGPVTIVVPESPSALSDAAQAAARARQTIIVAGGDGTVGRVLDAVAGLDATIGVVPAGSGNDFCRALDLPLEARAAARRIAAGSPRAIDLVQVNGRAIATVAGLGLVADASGLVLKLGAPGSFGRPIVRALGAYAYLLAAGALILGRRRTTTFVQIEARSTEGAWDWSGEAHAVFIANQALLGAGLRLPVAAALDDGECEIAIVPCDRRVRLLRNLTSLRTARPLPPGALLVHRATSACLRLRGPASMSADGECLATSDAFRAGVRKGAVRIIV